ncbi:MAG: fimbria/pilus chaperone family protein [Achromobacter xylosoxidans]|nr:fimbria/pilus chaperone family protein [Achromobacter xylosoxidans]
MRNQFSPLVKSLVSGAIATSALLCLSSPAAAVGIQPETSVVLVSEATGEGTMNVKNTGNETVLLVPTVESIAEDPEEWVVVTPPAAVVEPGQTQMVRFILSNGEPLKTQRLKRAIFEGIPQTSDKRNAVRLTVRQDLPLIAQPKGETPEKAPWKKLKWSTKDGALVLENPSPYVVRMDQRVQLQPQDKGLTLPKSYILPGETITVPTDAADLGAAQNVRIYPATVYGYQVEHFDAPLTL